MFVLAALAGRQMAAMARAEADLLTAVDLPGTPGPWVLVVLQPADCPASRERMAQWAQRPDLTVVGVLLGAADLDDGARRRLFADPGLPFPVVEPSSGRFARRLREMGYDRTPLVLAFDADRRLVRAASLGNRELAEGIEAFVTGFPLPLEAP